MGKVIAYFKTNKLHLVMWCVFLAIVITLFCNGTFSKYKSQYDVSVDLSVAKFEVIIQNGEEQTINLSENNTTDDYIFYIKNNSQVSVVYDVILTLPEGVALPEYVSVSIDGENEPVAVSNILLFKNVGMMSYNDIEQKMHVINFALDVDAYSVFGKEVKIDGIEIQVIATQLL